MAKFKKVITITPIFSLSDSRLQGLITDEVLVYKDAIEEALKKYDKTPIGLRTISVEKLHTRISGKPAITSLPLQRAIFVYYEREQISTPFLLGLVAQQAFLEMIKDIQSIEVFEEWSFIGKFKRASHLCLRRTQKGWMVDVSTYINSGLINAAERESSTSINTISFVEDPVTEEKIENEKDLSNKMIG